MTAPLRPPPGPPAARPAPTPTVFSPLADVTADPEREPSAEVRDALRRDQAELQREVILWQRWIRYVALLGLVGAAIAVSGERRALALTPLLSIAAAYAACVFVTGMAVQRARDITTGLWLPLLLVTADLVAVGAIFYVTSVPLVTN